MTLYRTVWTSVCALLTMVGLCLGIVVGPGPPTVVAGLFAVLAAALAWIRLWDTEAAAPRGRRHAPWPGTCWREVPLRVHSSATPSCWAQAWPCWHSWP